MATGRVPTTANSPLTTKGDLFGYSTAPARLAVGSDGDTIVADSSTATGLRYTAGTVQANPILNSAAQLWQRGTSFTITTPVYTADRWQAGRGANATGYTVTRQLTNDTTNLPNIQYCIRSARDSGNTGTQSLYLSQSLETVNSIPYAGKTVTVSFYARAGANYSASANALVFRFFTGTGTDQNVLTAGYTGSSQTATTFTLTTTWQRFSVTIAIPATTTEIGYIFDANPTGTAGAADFYEMTGMQIDIGSVALPFRTYAGTIQGELAACQRYFFRHNGSIVAVGTSSSTNGRLFMANMPVSLRGTPTMTKNGTVTVIDGNLSTYQSNPGFSNIYYGANSSTVKFDIALSSSPATNTYLILFTGQTSADSIDFSSEL